ncbi:MAG: FAD-dependent oxidoreductase [Lachnospiraceae bacterium]|nr:FAD-dependent oxidoreductase [Lachnospiraceae bacterium]
MKNVDLLIIGGGSAGLAAAAAAYDEGIRDILIVERSDYLGGILHQCIHNGFGLHRYKEELTGPEYARRSIEEVEKKNIPCLLHAFAISASADRIVTVVSPETGLLRIQAKAIVLAMGCRERSRGALMIPGTRPAGVITAGAAQKYLNLQGYLPGKEAVILGSGDIGLIMARQLVLEGIKVKEVVELMPFSSGLTRNIVQCLNDYNIPLSLSSTVIEIKGRSRVTGVVVAKVDENRKPVPGTEREISCDTLMISAGLIPENELSRSAGIRMSRSTQGAVVDQNLQTSIDGVFACGNVLHVHDLVDYVSMEGEAAGRNAARYLKGAARQGGFDRCIEVKEGPGVGALVPQYVDLSAAEGKIEFRFRPRGRYTGSEAVLLSGDEKIAAKRELIFTPGEMCTMSVDAAKLKNAQALRVEIRPVGQGVQE